MSYVQLIISAYSFLPIDKIFTKYFKEKSFFTFRQSFFDRMKKGYKDVRKILSVTVFVLPVLRNVFFVVHYPMLFWSFI